MERRNLALLCAGVVCFWLFALAFGTAQGKGLRIQPAVQTQAEPAVQTLTVTPPQLTLPCRAAILIDQTSGAVLYEMNADQTMPIASITKVMTLLLTFEAVHAGRLTMDTAVPVSEHAYHMGGSQIWLEPGEQFTLDEMLKAICVSSANDAAVAVAELVGGSEPAFVQQMNARAAELGMEHTTFRNACGLDTEGHLSTARDVAIMSRTILNTCPGCCTIQSARSLRVSAVSWISGLRIKCTRLCSSESTVLCPVPKPPFLVRQSTCTCWPGAVRRVPSAAARVRRWPLPSGLALSTRYSVSGWRRGQSSTVWTPAEWTDP